VEGTGPVRASAQTQVDHQPFHGPVEHPSLDAHLRNMIRGSRSSRILGQGAGWIHGRPRAASRWHCFGSARGRPSWAWGAWRHRL